MLVTEPVKQCNGPCGLKRPWSDFYAKVKWPDGSTRQPQSRCKECMATMQREHPESKRKYDRKRYRRVRNDAEAWSGRLSEQRAYYAERQVSDPEWLPLRLEQIALAKRRRTGGRARVRRGGSQVDVSLVVAAFERSGVSLSEVALRMGLISRGKPDTSRLQRLLRQRSVELCTAVRVLDALGLDPVEVGL